MRGKADMVERALGKTEVAKSGEDDD